MKILVTGGAGFIGSALIRHIIENSIHEVVNLDNLTYAGNIDNLAQISKDDRYVFERVDICNQTKLHEVFNKYTPDVVMHLAAESHVDRSIEIPSNFIDTNIVGTFNMLEASRAHWDKLIETKKNNFRFHHISTDEVYGDLTSFDEPFTEQTPYAPSSPYSASKAGADHLVKAWGRTYNLPIIITNCSNNYGPYQFPEKLIPLVILNALSGKPLPIYGDGLQIRDWLYVEDHARALYEVVTKSDIGKTYNIGGLNEVTNIDVVKNICDILDELVPEKLGSLNSFKDLITFIDDRPGHDRRYAINATRIEQDLNWKPHETFESGLRKTIIWFIENQSWWESVLNGNYLLNNNGAL